MDPAAPLQPGGWIGVIGGGQLGRMIAVDARRMGFRTCVLDPTPACPAAQVADAHIAAPYHDQAAAAELARRCDVVTFEFENVDAAAVASAEALRPVRPSSGILRVAQHRLVEKQTLADHGFPVARFYPVRRRADLDTALESIGNAAVLKAATSGYDGRGQVVVRSNADAAAAYDALHVMSDELICEELVSFSAELSVICARTRTGATACFPPAENVHRQGILDASVAPARVEQAVAEAARELARAIATELELVGLLAVEMFLTSDGRLLVNEIAPRPHNSGHYTLEACRTSQFEQLIRAICNLPLGSPDLLSPAAMVNLLGDIWEKAGGAPDFAAAMSVPGARLHLYGKRDARRGRKMGHITVTAPSRDEALELALRARALAAGEV